VQVQTAWRGKEVVKLVIHDDKSARKVNLPRLNLLLRELEEKSGGVLVDAAGSSIWLYRWDEVFACVGLLGQLVGSLVFVSETPSCCTGSCRDHLWCAH
jgi:hypothetical protein